MGAILIPGAAGPKLVSRDMVRQMKEGSVIVHAVSVYPEQVTCRAVAESQNRRFVPPESLL